MKTLLIVIVVLLLAAVLFYLVGMISPGQESLSEVRVNAPLEHSWEIYHDEELMSEWMPSVKKINLVSGQQNSVGAQYEVTMEDQNGKDSKMLETLTQFDPPTEYAMDYSNDLLTGNMEVIFEALGDTVTVIKTTNNYKGNTSILNSMFHFFNWKIEQETQKQGDALKLLIEESYIQKQATQPKQSTLIPLETTPIDSSSIN